MESFTFTRRSKKLLTKLKWIQIAVGLIETLLQLQPHLSCNHSLETDIQKIMCKIKQELGKPFICILYHNGGIPENYANQPGMLSE